MKTRLTIAAMALLGTSAVYAGHHMKDADADTNGDGFISLEEAKAAQNARIEERFARTDTNGDGLLSVEEREAARQARREEMKERFHGRPPMPPDPERMIERLDADDSGTVSLDEFQGRRFAPDADSFNAADADGNGELDAEEFGALMAARHAERAARKARGRDND